MIAELGNYALALSLAVSFFLAVFPLWGAEKGHSQLMSLARPMTYGLFFSLTIAFAALFYLFAVNDFSVQYVVNNSNSSLPIYYRLSAVWGSHEGSLLLWIWLLTLWGAAVALFSKHLPQEAVARVLGIMGIISMCSCWFCGRCRKRRIYWHCGGRPRRSRCRDDPLRCGWRRDGCAGGQQRRPPHRQPISSLRKEEQQRFDLFADALMDVLTGTDKEEHNHSLLSQRYTLVAEPPKSAILCGMNKICTVDM